MNKTGIGWTDYTLNPLTGCSKISKGCDHCYANELYNRHKWSFDPTLRLERLKEIKTIPAGSKVFLGSVTDVFHDFFMKHPEKPIDRVMDAIASRPDVTFQILTKRPWNAQSYFGFKHRQKAPENLWLGTSVESRRWLTRVKYLLLTNATTKFLSCEPLLENIVGSWYNPRKKITDMGLDWYLEHWAHIDWVIVGAESGSKRRPFEEEWADNILESCRRAGIPFFYKQGSDFKPGQHTELKGNSYMEFPGTSNWRTLI